MQKKVYKPLRRALLRTENVEEAEKMQKHMVWINWQWQICTQNIKEVASKDD